MRLLAACILFMVSLASGFASSAEMPKEMVGVWATAESEFEGDKLIGGAALYLLASGNVAFVGAPLPVGRCANGSLCTPIIGMAGIASYNAATGRLTLALRDGEQRSSFDAQFDAGDRVLVLHMREREILRLVLRSSVIPKGLEEKFSRAP